jgi:hypothetical protein
MHLFQTFHDKLQRPIHIKCVLPMIDRQTVCLLFGFGVHSSSGVILSPLEELLAD